MRKISTTPFLENGDRLNRWEFEKRYQAMGKIQKAELIEGVVYMPAALRFRSHGQPHANLMIWLGMYKIATPKVELGDNVTIRLDLDNAPQPDGVLLIDGGQTKISEDDYIEGAPELIVEVAASTATYDLHDKKNAYRRNGVLEYLVWRVYDNEIDWFSLEAGKYILLSPDNTGIIRSQVFPSLWLAIPSLLSGNMNDVLAVLQKGLESPEYKIFSESLDSGNYFNG